MIGVIIKRINFMGDSSIQQSRVLLLKPETTLAELLERVEMNSNPYGDAEIHITRPPKEKEP